MNDSNDADDGEGGETACYAHLICPTCGGVSPTHQVDCENGDGAKAPISSQH